MGWAHTFVDFTFTRRSWTLLSLYNEKGLCLLLHKPVFQDQSKAQGQGQGQAHSGTLFSVPFYSSYFVITKGNCLCMLVHNSLIKSGFCLVLVLAREVEKLWRTPCTMQATIWRYGFVNLFRICERFYFDCICICVSLDFLFFIF